jgi:hypothetical protein
MPDILKLRDDLADELKAMVGVISVGIGKNDDRVVLVVSIEPSQYDGDIPSQYKGVRVSVKEIGIGVFHRASAFTQGGVYGRS